VVPLATFTKIGETTVDLHHHLRVLLTPNMITHLVTPMGHALDTDLLQGTCTTDALLTVTPIHLLATVLGHLVLQGDVTISGIILLIRRGLVVVAVVVVDIVVVVLPDTMTSRLKGIVAVPSLLPEAMAVLQVILPMDRDDIQVRPLAVRLRHVVPLVVLVAARVVACLGVVGVMIENMVVAAIMEMPLRL